MWVIDPPPINAAWNERAGATILATNQGSEASFQKGLIHPEKSSGCFDRQAPLTAITALVVDASPIDLRTQSS